MYGIRPSVSYEDTVSAACAAGFKVVDDGTRHRMPDKVLMRRFNETIMIEREKWTIEEPVQRA